MKTLTLILIIFSSSVIAGIGGAGGQAYVCRSADGKVLNAELWDYYEARNIRNINLDIGHGRGDLNEALKNLHQRLKQLSPGQEKIFEEKAPNLLSEFFFLYNQILPGPEEQTPPQTLPAGCSIEQLVIKKEHPLPREKKYYVNGDIWRVLNGENRAAALYYETALSITDKYWRRYEGLRYWNAVLASKEELSKLEHNPEAIYKLFSSNGFYVVTLNDIEYTITNDYPVEFYPNGQIKGGRISYQQVNVYGQKVFATEVSFFEDGTISSLKNDSDQYIDSFFDRYTNAYFRAEIFFFPGGRIKSGTLTHDFQDSVTGQKFNYFDRLYYSQDGKLLKAFTKLETKTYFLIGGFAFFSPDGKIVSYSKSNGWILTNFGKIEFSSFGDTNNEISFGTSGRPQGKIYNNQLNSFSIQNQWVGVLKNSEILLSDQGEVLSFYPDLIGESLKLRVGDQSVLFHTRPFTSSITQEEIRPQLTFHPGYPDAIKSGWLLQKTALKIVGGDFREFPADTLVHFNAQGEALP